MPPFQQIRVPGVQSDLSGIETLASPLSRERPVIFLRQILHPMGDSSHADRNR